MQAHPPRTRHVLSLAMQESPHAFPFLQTLQHRVWAPQADDPATGVTAIISEAAKQASRYLRLNERIELSQKGVVANMCSSESGR